VASKDQEVNKLNHIIGALVQFIDRDDQEFPQLTRDQIEALARAALQAADNYDGREGSWW
jgi:hypothetical protein